MEKKIDYRNLKERMFERRKSKNGRLNRKTEATKQREEINLKIRETIDFENVVGRAAMLQRTGDSDFLGSKER